MSSPVLAITTRSSPATSSIPRASLAPPVPPASTTTGPAHPSPTIRTPVLAAVVRVDPDQQRLELLGHPRLLQRPRVDAAQPVDPLDQRDRLVLVRRVVAAHEHVLVEHRLGVAQARRRHRVERGDDAHAVGHHLRRLLRGGALPDAERPRSLARDGSGERHRRVDQQLAGAQVRAQVGQRLGLRPERDAQDDDRHAVGRVVAAADHLHARALPAQREPRAERAGERR